MSVTPKLMFWRRLSLVLVLARWRYVKIYSIISYQYHLLILVFHTESQFPFAYKLENEMTVIHLTIVKTVVFYSTENGNKIICKQGPFTHGRMTKTWGHESGACVRINLNVYGTIQYNVVEQLIMWLTLKYLIQIVRGVHNKT